MQKFHWSKKWDTIYDKFIAYFTPPVNLNTFDVVKWMPCCFNKDVTNLETDFNQTSVAAQAAL